MKFKIMTKLSAICDILTLSTMGKIFSRWQTDDIFTYFFQETVFNISSKLFPIEKICMKSQILFSGKNEKNIISLLSAELV